jgi:hypothetical protein
MATLRTRVSELEHDTPCWSDVREMSDAQLWSYLADSLGYWPTIADLECIADGAAT